MLPRLRSIALAALAAAALTAGPAAAKDFCTLGVAGCDSPSGGVQQALDAAKSNPGPDRVLIGGGAWNGHFFVADDVTIEGTPQAMLTSQPPLDPAGATPGLYLVGPGAVVRNIRIALPAGNGARGLALQNGASAENVKVDGANATYATGATLLDGARFSGEINLPPTNTGAVAGVGSSVIDARIAAGRALHVQAGDGGALVRRSTLVGRDADVVSAESGALTIEDALVDARAPGAADAITTYALSQTPKHTIDLRNVTVLGHGDDPKSGGV